MMHHGRRKETCPPAAMTAYLSHCVITSIQYIRWCSLKKKKRYELQTIQKEKLRFQKMGSDFAERCMYDSIYSAFLYCIMHRVWMSVMLLHIYDGINNLEARASALHWDNVQRLCALNLPVIISLDIKSGLPGRKTDINTIGGGGEERAGETEGRKEI